MEQTEQTSSGVTLRDWQVTILHINGGYALCLFNSFYMLFHEMDNTIYLMMGLPGIKGDQKPNSSSGPVESRVNESHIMS